MNFFFHCVTFLLIVSIAQVSTFGSVNFLYRKNEELIFKSASSFKDFATVSASILCVITLADGYDAWLTVLHTVLVADRSLSGRKMPHPSSPPSPQCSSHSITGRCWNKGGLVSLLQGGTMLKGHPSSRALQGID